MERHLPYEITPATRHRWTCLTWTQARHDSSQFTYPELIQMQ